MCNNEQFLIKLQVQWITGISHFFQTISHHWAVYNHSKIAVFNRPIALRQAGKVPTIERQPSLRKVTSKLGHGMERSGPGQPSGAVIAGPWAIWIHLGYWKWWECIIKLGSLGILLLCHFEDFEVAGSVEMIRAMSFREDWAVARSVRLWYATRYQPFGSSLRSTMYTRVSFT